VQEFFIFLTNTRNPVYRFTSGRTNNLKQLDCFHRCALLCWTEKWWHSRQSHHSVVCL